MFMLLEIVEKGLSHPVGVPFMRSLHGSRHRQEPRGKGAEGIQMRESRPLTKGGRLGKMSSSCDTDATLVDGMSQVRT